MWEYGLNPDLFKESTSGHLTPIPEGGYAFVPNPLPPDNLLWDPELVEILSSADRATGELAGIGRSLPNPSLLVRPFLRREAVLSSRIEGTRASLSDLLVYETILQSYLFVGFPRPTEAFFAAKPLLEHHGGIPAALGGSGLSHMGQCVVAEEIAWGCAGMATSMIANDLAHMQILAQVGESDIDRIKQGQPVQFTVQALPGRTFTGAVQQVRLQSAPLDNVVNYTVVVTVENPGGKLLHAHLARSIIPRKRPSAVAY